MGITRLKLGLTALTLAMATVLSGCAGSLPKQSGAFVSKDAGLTFTASPDLKAKKAKRARVYPPLAVTAIAVNPTDSKVILAGTADDLYRTTDGGQSWQRLTTKLPTATKAVDVEQIRWHPTQPTTFYVSGVSGGYGKVFKSTDRGDTLQDVFTGSKPKQAVTGIAVEAGDTLYIGDQQGGVYKSMDSAGSWHRMFSITSPVTSLQESGASLFVGTLGQGVFRSTDGGVTFAAANGNLTDDQLRVWDLTAAFGRLYVASDAGLYSTQDFGGNWQSIGNPVPVKGGRVEAVAATSQYLYFAIGAVVYRTAPNGGDFVPVQLPLAAEVWGLSTTGADQSTVFAAANSKDHFADRFREGLAGINLLGAPR